MKKIIIIIITLILQSCAVSKNATKNKKEDLIKKDVKEKEIEKTFDFSEVNYDSDTFTYTPADSSKYMHIVTSKGDTIQAKNTSITRKKEKTKTSNNIVKETDKESLDKTVKESKEVIKTKDKEESISDRFILYIVLGIVLLGVVIGSIALFLMYKSINKNADALNTLISNIS